MEIARSYITDKEGSIKSVVIDFKTFKKIENILLDQGLAKAMEEVENDEELSLDDAKLLLPRIMEATIKRNFIKDLRRLPKEIKESIEKFIFEQSVKANTIHDLGKLTKILGYSGYYRKRFGDYRIGFKIKGKKIIFYRALHRREIYSISLREAKPGFLLLLKGDRFTEGVELRCLCVRQCN